MAKEKERIPSGKGVTIDRELLRTRFREYNVRYFDGVLKTPQFSTFRGSGKSVGLCTNHEDGRRPKILMARNAILSEDDFTSVLVHEMIHLYLFQTDKRYGWPFHGRKFRRMVSDIREKHGLIIRIRYPNIMFNIRKTGKS